MLSTLQHSRYMYAHHLLTCIKINTVKLWCMPNCGWYAQNVFAIN